MIREAELLQVVIRNDTQNMINCWRALFNITSIYVFINIYRLYVYIYIYLCMYKYVYRYMYIYVYICLYLCIRMYLCICMYVCIYVYTYVYMYIIDVINCRRCSGCAQRWRGFRKCARSATFK
jgi:hypothetical protein